MFMCMCLGVIKARGQLVCHSSGVVYLVFFERVSLYGLELTQ